MKNIKNIVKIIVDKKCKKCKKVVALIPAICRKADLEAGSYDSSCEKRQELKLAAMPDG
jgi:hypothetical protein